MSSVAILACLLFSISASSAEQPLSAEALHAYQACQHTPDCVRVTNGCCDCANGGSTVSVARKYEKKIRALFRCEKVICSQKAGDCLFQEPVCVKGLCQLGPQKQLFPKPEQKR